MEKKEVISWDKCFMMMAITVSKRSKDPNTQTGAIIVAPNKQIVAMGYNGWIKGAKEGQFPWDRVGPLLHTKYPYVVHCEENAIYCSMREVAGGTLYTTLFPCNECAKSIVQTGIKEVVYLDDKYHDEPAWIASRQLLDLGNVKVRKYDNHKEPRLQI